YPAARRCDERHHAVEASLAAHPDDAPRITAYRNLAEQWRAAYAPLLDEPVPPELLPRRKRRWRLPAAMAAGLMVVAIGAWQLFEQAPHYLPGTAATEMVRRAALAHAVYAPEVNHPVEAASGKDELLQWLSERLQMKVQAPGLEAAGHAFIGGPRLARERPPAA